ncbi:ADP-ribosylation factor-like protein 2-binding protein isoform X2 [Ceratitis capitata]|uniref:ADP-ribosylation factor-like protein 2-binding protein isoform X2 n=1 Tax=Ceratitis capitata TaxID=7213 RepID=UPI000A10DEED|nr:ADP-ribosylation factor-like protein 2-binding protein isoform X2 [Ceratitis capitata]
MWTIDIKKIICIYIQLHLINKVLHNNFLEKYWHCIEDTEENKLEYMDIFQEYTNTFETFLIQQLCARIPDFNMRRFEQELEENEAFDDILSSGEIIELLHSFNSFETFKELMLDYRRTKEGHMEHLNTQILVTTPYAASDSTIPIGIVEDE